MYHALESCREMLIKAGGHEQAVGLTLETSQLGKFKEKINTYTQPRLARVSQPTLMVDAEVLPGLDENLMRNWRPSAFGYSNPEPSALPSSRSPDCRVVGRRQTSQIEGLGGDFPIRSHCF